MAPGRCPRANSSCGLTSSTVTTCPEPVDQLRTRDRLQGITIVEVTANDALDLGRLRLGDAPQGGDQIQDRVARTVGRTLVANAPRGNEPAATHALEMLGGVGDGQPEAIGQHLDAALALGQLLQEFQTMRMSRGLRHRGELAEQNVFWARA